MAVEMFGLRYEKYDVGDDVEIHLGGEEPSRGRVIAILNLPGYTMEHYVIELPTAVDAILEVRSGNTMEMTRAKPLPEDRLKQYRDALRALMTNPHLSLGDLVYTVKERELAGWDGPAVKAWSDAVSTAERLLKEDGL